MPNSLQPLANKLDKAIEEGDLETLREVTQAWMTSLQTMLEDGDLASIEQYILDLTVHVGDRWNVIPAGYREIFASLFVGANQRIQANVEVYRAFADKISSKTDLNLPWNELELPRRGIAVLYNFVPFADTGASVASKRLREFGGAVDVYSCSSIGKKTTDFTPYRISRPYIREAVTLPVGPSWASWGPQYEFVKLALDEIERNEASGIEYDFIYTRAMWVPSHYAGALHKLRRPNVEWIAEFSDPLSLDVEGLPRAEHPPQKHEVFDELVTALEEQFGPLPEAQRGIFRVAELLSYAFADRIIFTNDLQMATMVNHIENPILKSRVLKHAEVSNHPTLPRQYYEVGNTKIELDNDHVNLGYFGQFYATRGLGDLTRAMRMLPKALSKKVRLHVFTTYVPEQSGGSRPAGMDRKLYERYVQRTVDALGSSGLEEQVVLHPSLPYLDFLGVLDDFDYLLVNDAKSGMHHTVNPFLPSKYGDYKGSTSKIWAMCEPESCLDRGGSHIKTPLGDANAVRAFLIDALRADSHHQVELAQ